MASHSDEKKRPARVRAPSSRVIDKRGLLAENAFLRDLPADVVRRIADLSVTQRFADGARIHQKGDEPTGLYGIVSGGVKVSSRAADGRESLLTVLEPGHWFGEIALFDGLPRTHDAHAKGATVLVLLRRLDFLALVGERPELYAHFVRALCRRIRGCFALIEDIVFLDLAARLAKRLLMLAAVHGEPSPGGGVRIALRLPQEELGRMVGASRESVGKQLKRWQRSGLLELRYSRVVLRDPRALEEIVAAAEAGGARER